MPPPQPRPMLLAGMMAIIAMCLCLGQSVNAFDTVKNILLPSQEHQLAPFLLDFGEFPATGDLPCTSSVPRSMTCWRLVSNSASNSQEDVGDDSLIQILPVLQENAEDEEGEECVYQFHVKIRADSAKTQGQRSLLFETTGASTAQLRRRRVDVHTNLLHTLEIATTTRRLDIGEEQTLTVIGKDAVGNVFTSLQGLAFHFELLGEGAQHCTFTGPAVHNQIIVRGTSTGRAWVAVHLPTQQLTSKVQLIVARTAYICPGEVVSSPHALTQADFEFCLSKRNGCFSKATREFAWKISEENKQGFTLQVQDEFESTNQVAARVNYSPFAALAHFLAPLPVPAFEVDQCPYVRAKLDGTWPALSKHLPREPSYFRNLPHYFIWTHSSWVLLGLLQLENLHFAPLHLSKETFSFKPMNDTAQLLTFSPSGEFHGATVFKSHARTGTVRVRLETAKHGAVDFLITIVDPVAVRPGNIVMDLDCAAKAQVSGGTGHFYKTSRAATFRVNNASELVIPAQTKETRFEVKVWDGIWEQIEAAAASVGSNARAPVHVTVHRITRFKIAEGRRVFAKLGEIVTLHLVGAQDELCCSNKRVDQSEWKFDGAALSKVADTAADEVAMPATCSAISLRAKQVGVTQVTILGQVVEVEVRDALDFSPQPGLVLTAGCEQTITILNTPAAASSAAKLYIDGKLASLQNPTFSVSCGNVEGAFSREIRVELAGKTYSKRFAYECIKPASCTLDLFHEDRQEDRIVAKHILLNLPGVHARATVWNAAKNKHTQYAQCWKMQVKVNSTLVPTPGDALQLNALGLATVSASLLNLNCEPVQIIVAREFQLATKQPSNNELKFWADDCSEHEIGFELGSGTFAASAFSAKPFRRRLLLPRHGADATYANVVVTDQDFYPTTSRTVSIDFIRDIPLELRAATEHLVQHGMVDFVVEPSYLFADAGEGDERDVVLEWEPRNVFSKQQQRVTGNTFSLFAERSGNVQVDFSIASRCNKQNRVRVRREFQVYAYRAIALLPGDVYELSQCDGDRAASTLTLCKQVRGASDAFAVSANGTVSAACGAEAGATALVHCSPNNQYFALAIAAVDQVAISPKEEQWLLPNSNNNADRGEDNQVHFELLQRGLPAFWLEQGMCRRNLVTDHTWKIEVSNAATRHLVTKQEIVSVFVDKASAGAALQVKATVRIGSACQQPSQQQQPLVSSKRYSVSKLPQVLSIPAGQHHVLLPPGAQFDVETSEPVICKFTCPCNSSNSEAIWLEACRIHTGAVAEAASCSLSLFTKKNERVAFFQSQIEVKPIASLSLRVIKDESLVVTFHDEHARLFTRGWFDGTIKRALEFQVPAPLYLGQASKLNCSKPFVGEHVALQVKTSKTSAAVAAAAHSSILVTLRGDDGTALKASSTLTTSEWKCLGKRYQVLGTCLGFYEWLVLIALCATLLVLALQHNFETATALAALLLAIFLWT